MSVQVRPTLINPKKTKMQLVVYFKANKRTPTAQMQEELDLLPLSHRRKLHLALDCF